MVEFSGEQLRSFRQKYGVSCPRIARYFDMNEATLYRWEKRRNPPCTALASYVCYMVFKGHIQGEELMKLQSQGVGYVGAA